METPNAKETWVSKSGFSAVVSACARSSKLWSVWLHFDYHAWRLTAADGLKVKDYLLKVLKGNEAILSSIFPSPGCLFHFAEQEAAEAFYKLIPEEGAVEAVLYDPKGVLVRFNL